MEQGNSKQAFVYSIQELLQVRRARFAKHLLENILEKIDSYGPWFQEDRTLEKETWEKVGEVLRTTQADFITLCLWMLIKDAIDK